MGVGVGVVSVCRSVIEPESPDEGIYIQSPSVCHEYRGTRHLLPKVGTRRSSWQAP